MSTQGLRKIPSRIPPGYLAKVLKRLLPPEHVIASLSGPELALVAQKKSDIEHLIKSDPARFFIPNPGGQAAFLSHWDYDWLKTVLLFLAGNKTGKTTGGAMLVGERLYGGPLWNRENRTSVSYQTPAIGICFAEDFESHRDTILPTIASWWPRGFIKRIVWGTANTPSEIICRNGSVLRFKTYAQGSESAEGKDWDIAWADEPPSRQLYNAIMRGLVATGGKFIISATLLKEVWLFDEMDQPYAAGFNAEIHDNPHLSIPAKEAFLASLDDREREVRETGKPITLSGLIYREFKDKGPYVIPRFELPEHWPYLIGVDPHERKPVHVLFFTIAPTDEIIAFGYALLRGSLTDIFEGLERKINAIGIPPKSPVKVCIMDPNRGAARQINNKSWQDEFEKNGYDVILGQDDINIGHSKLAEAFKLRESPLTDAPHPSFMFTEDCIGKGGPVWQLLRYAWDDWQDRRSRSERAVKEKPRDAYKDFPDICRYIVMEELKFKNLTQGYKVIKSTTGGVRPYGQVRSPHLSEARR